jgi:prepilin-type N-terminal cleavage/methylation domain-containing protein
MAHRSERGFTLLEVVVTIFIVSLLVYACTSIASTLTLARSAEYQSIAARIAATKLDTLRTLGYAALPGSGAFSSNELSALPQSSGSITVSAINAKTKQVTATVSWNDKSARSVSVTTLITETGGL